MLELDISKFKTIPFDHQVEGVKALLRCPSFALFDEMGAGKSKQVVDAACTLATNGEITTVVVVCPASVRCVWLDKDFGEIRKHAWVPSQVIEWHSKQRFVWQDADPNLTWVVTNYEFLRSRRRLLDLKESLRSSAVMLVLDESSYVKSRSSKQADAIADLRLSAKRCVLLNGTPVTDSPLDLWSQLQICNKDILGRKFKNFFHFRARYAIMGGWNMKEVVKWQRLDELSELVKPFVLRRLKQDCLDLPEKLFTQREVPLCESTWRIYQELKRDALITLDTGDKLIEPNSAVRLMRLAQLTSGILGSTTPNFDPKAQGSSEIFEVVVEHGPKDISDEKLRWCLTYMLEENDALATIIWCRWRHERERLTRLLRENASYDAYELYGGQPKHERELAISAFTIPGGNRKVLIAQPHAGGHGLNLVAATRVLYLSNDFSLGVRLQSEDRCHRPGQQHNVHYVDILATGPKGQRTVDHAIVKALRLKQNLAEWTTSRWRKELEDE